MIMRIRVVMGAAALVAAAGAQRLAAQTDHAHFGLHAGYNTTYEDATIGAQLSVPVARHAEFYPSFDYYIQSPGTAFQVNADFKYRAFGERTDWLYIGSGAGIRHVSVDGTNATRVGWNLLMGAESLRGNVHPFGEARATISNGTRFQIVGGINITIGDHRRR
jgi:hypothetical protein